MSMLFKAKEYVALLQLEDYRIGRFLRASFRTLYRSKKKLIKPIEWTTSLKTVVLAAAILVALDVLAVALLSSSFGSAWVVVFSVLAFVIDYYLFFLFLSLVVAVLKPFDRYRKQKIITRARNHIRQQKGLTVIGVAGSYGKTSMKEMLLAALSEKSQVVATIGNENTDIGIARRILTKVDSGTDIFIMEMGEFEPGDLKDICHIATPDIVVVTGINEAHLERMKDISVTTDAILEAVRFAKPHATIVANQDDQNVVRSINNALSGRGLIWYSKERSSNFVVKSNVFDSNALVRKLVIESNGKLLRADLNIIAPYISGTVLAALEVVQVLQQDVYVALQRITTLKPVPHRLEVRRTADGVITIDDTYNSNPEGVRSALHLLSQFSGRKIYVTPGLVELGDQSASMHEQLGKEIAAVADIVVLIETRAYLDLLSGLKAGGCADEKILVFPSMVDVLEQLPAYLKKGDVVLYQNDWSDNYL